ncbi:MAG: M1 family metallopeptidase [Chitinophagaceae bacterium]
MKHLPVLCTALLFCATISAQKPGATIDVQHYNYALTLNDSSNEIQGQATVTISFIQPSSSILLDLADKKSSGKGMTVSSIITDNDTKLSFTHGNDQLNIILPATAKAGDKKTITITYSGIPADGLVIANNKYHHRGFFADNWPNRAHNWIPCIDHPSDKATVDFTVTAPAHYQVIANGRKTEERELGNNQKQTRYSEAIALPTKVMVIGVADFAVQQAGAVNGIPVYSWIYPEDKDKGFYDYAQATEILPYFISHVGSYAYEKLANVQSTTIFGGMENAGTIFYHENSVTGTRKSESLLTHEIAHQWFGDMATETDWRHLWLSEGFATYMTILYFENKYGTDTARKMLTDNRRQVIAFSKRNHSPVVDSSITNYMELLNANSYQKGGWALHMLCQQLGDSAFWKGIRTYYARYAGKNASTDDLRKVMEEVSGQDLQLFFSQWLYTAGQPSVEAIWEYDAVKKAVNLTIKQKQEQLFTFPLEISINSTDYKSPLKTFIIKDRQQVFSIPFKNTPLDITLDPLVKLLFEGEIKKIQ